MTSPHSPARSIFRFLLACGMAAAIVLPIILIGGLFLFPDLPGSGASNVLPAGTSSTQTSPPLVKSTVSSEGTPAAQASEEERDSAVGSRIADVVARSQGKSSEQNMSQLDSMSKRLDSVASDQSVDDLAGRMRGWMGLRDRTAIPKTDSKIEEFEIDSAQLHDVKRTESKPGSFSYTAVLIDAQGDTVEIQLTEAEGRETYALMQKIKSNPLLEKVYRQIAMPLLDSLVQSARDKVESSKAK